MITLNWWTRNKQDTKEVVGAIFAIVSSFIGSIACGLFAAMMFDGLRYNSYYESHVSFLEFVLGSFAIFAVYVLMSSIVRKWQDL